MNYHVAKYDHLAALVREMEHAEGVVVVVVHGSNGTGYSVCAVPEVEATIPNMLRVAAVQIEEEQNVSRKQSGRAS